MRIINSDKKVHDIRIFWYIGLVFVLLSGFWYVYFAPETPQYFEEGEEIYIADEKPDIIDINVADYDELVKVKGIGDVTAKSIIEYRKSIGSFKSIEEIKNVKGIGEKTFDDIKQYITVSNSEQIQTQEYTEIPEYTEMQYDDEVQATSDDIGVININTASAKELEKLSGIGEKTALKIIEYRQSVGGFKTIDEIKNVSGIGDKKFDAIKDFITVE